MSKPIIAVDIDEVLVPHFQDLIDWYNSQYGTRLTLHDIHASDTTNWGNASFEETVRRVHGFYETDSFKHVQPFAEAKPVLLVLSERYSLVIVTARDTIIEKMTRDWLALHFQDFFGEAHFTAQYSLEGKGRSKAEVCKEINAAYLIDDDPKNILAACEQGVRGILFGDYPWSKSKKLPGGVTRCHDWAAVQEYFNGRR